MLSQFGCLPAKNRAETAMQGPFKELFLVSILFSTAGKMQDLKVARSRGCWQGQSPRQVGQGKTRSYSVERKKCPEVHNAAQVQKTEEGELLTEKLALLHYLRVTMKNEAREETTATSKKRLGQCAPGELVKNTLLRPILGQLSPNIRVGHMGICF